ncbi:hypothetical protein F4824DRAFT_442038 [Ustulina deusta]|nr:hypothetical protein F4824DRAFT_442038 [Ustulina deusta]
MIRNPRSWTLVAISRASRRWPGFDSPIESQSRVSSFFDNCLFIPLLWFLFIEFSLSGFRLSISQIREISAELRILGFCCTTEGITSCIWIEYVTIYLA